MNFEGWNVGRNAKKGNANFWKSRINCLFSVRETVLRADYLRSKKQQNLELRVKRSADRWRFKFSTQARQAEMEIGHTELFSFVMKRNMGGSGLKWRLWKIQAGHCCFVLYGGSLRIFVLQLNFVLGSNCLNLLPIHFSFVAEIPGALVIFKETGFS